MAEAQTHKLARQLPEFPRAACRGLPLALFIGDTAGAHGAGDLARVRHARQVCWDCPERHPCREYAIANPAMLGVWGGTTEKERQAIRGHRAMDAS
jgi:WhiB family redox-sensing transcriptional regulator